MKRVTILPANKGYTLLLCCFLVGAFVFVGGRFEIYIGTLNGTLQGRPILHRWGKALLWAKGATNYDVTEWFDVTDALVDPKRFDHGLGKDAIPSIDAPAFAEKGDPILAKYGDPDKLRVIGVQVEGEAKAYPIRTMSKHELVNDTFGDAHLTVAW